MSRAARRSLILVTAPAKEPVTLTEAKGWAKVETTDDDATIGSLVTAARTAAEEYLRRALVTQTYKLTHDLHGNDLYHGLPEGTYDLPVTALYGGMPRDVELPKGPVQSITSVTAYALDNTAGTVASSNYFLDTAGNRLVLNSGCVWPANLRPRAAVEITYVAGYGDTGAAVPQPIKTAILIHVASLYEQRGQSADAMDLPPGAKQLLTQYRVLGSRG